MFTRTRMTLGVDIGTTGARACVVSEANRVIATASVSYEPDRPQPGWAEQDPIVWWQAFRDVVAEVLKYRETRSISAISLSSQSTALIPMDKQFKPVRKAIIWQDTRCSAECQDMAQHLGAERIREVTGWAPCTFLVWPKILWFRVHEPELYDATFKFMQVGGFLIHRLCGATVLDRANAVGYPIDLRSGEWNRELTRWREFPIEKLPHIVPSAVQVGRVSIAASRATGLASELPIIAGGMDTACAAFAVGVYQPKRAFEVSGTSGGVGIVSEAPNPNPALGVAHHLLDNLYINHAPLAAAGASLAWMKDELCWSEEIDAAAENVSVWNVMEREVAALGTEPTGILFLPYLAGERAPVWDPRTSGAFLGLTLATTRAQMIKAVMEGTGYALRQNMDIAARAGLFVDHLRSCGGGTKNDTWCQLKADMTGKPLVVFRDERDAAFGAGLLAGLGAGVWKLEHIEEVLENEQVTIYEPRDKVTQAYAPYQAAYEQAYPQLKEVLAR